MGSDECLTLLRMRHLGQGHFAATLHLGMNGLELFDFSFVGSFLLAQIRGPIFAASSKIELVAQQLVFGLCGDRIDAAAGIDRTFGRKRRY